MNHFELLLTFAPTNTARALTIGEVLAHFNPRRASFVISLHDAFATVYLDTDLTKAEAFTATAQAANTIDSILSINLA